LDFHPTLAFKICPSQILTQQRRLFLSSPPPNLLALPQPRPVLPLYFIPSPHIFPVAPTRGIPFLLPSSSPDPETVLPLHEVVGAESLVHVHVSRPYLNIVQTFVDLKMCPFNICKMTT
jgi:hypothetical protein